jgi:hypothetical protein
LNALGELVMLEQVGRLQLFMIYGVVFAHKCERGLVVKVLSLALHLLMRFSEQLHRLASAMVPQLAPRDTPLRCCQRAFGLATPARGKDSRPVREGRERL